MIGLVFWILILGILWRVPEFKFLVFFVLANNAVYTLPYLPVLTAEPSQWGPYLISVAIGDAVFCVIATPLILFRKWQNAHKSGGEKNLDKEMERIRADIAAREQSSQ